MVILNFPNRKRHKAPRPASRPTALVHPFPSARHRRMVSTIVRWMLKCSSAEVAEERLLQHLSIHCDYLRDRGISEDDICRDVMGFGAACRSVLSTEHAVILDRAVAMASGRRRGGGIGLAPATEKSAPSPLINFTFPRKVALFTPIKPPEYVRRIARIVLEQAADEGERFLCQEMAVVTENLVATGADPDAVHREVGKLEAAIRRQLWDLVMNAGVPK